MVVKTTRGSRMSVLVESIKLKIFYLNEKWFIIVPEIKKTYIENVSMTIFVGSVPINKNKNILYEWFGYRSTKLKS